MIGTFADSIEDGEDAQDAKVRRERIAMDFTDKVAIVTGGSRGIGAATARLLVEHGARVLVAYRENDVAANQLAAELNESGTQSVVTHRCNVGEWSDVQEMVDRCAQELGAVDVLVNNASVATKATLESITVEDWAETRRVNLDGPFFCCKATLPHMRERGGGAIVNVSSLAAATGGATSPAYSATKAALLGFTKKLALELAPEQIRVNIVAPGMTDTDMQRDLGAGRLGAGSDFAETVRKLIPLGRMADPSEIASVIAFLCSTGASYITGECVYVTGGK